MINTDCVASDDFIKAIKATGLQSVIQSPPHQSSPLTDTDLMTCTTSDVRRLHKTRKSWKICTWLQLSYLCDANRCKCSSIISLPQLCYWRSCIRRCWNSPRWPGSPGTGHPLVVVLRVHGQNGDPRANVDQQHGEGVVQGAGRFHAALGVRGVLKIVALGVSVEAHPINIQEAVDQAVQLIQLQQL